MKRRTGYYGQQLADSDFLQVQSNTQKYLGFLMADVFGSTAALFTGLTVTPGTGFTLNVGVGNLYQQIAAEATAWGSAGHGLPSDSTVITKQGCVETALANQFSGSFAVPGSGVNYYTLEAKITDADTDLSSPPLTFTDTSGIRSSQVLFTNRTTEVLLFVKGPSTSSPPSPDAGWTTIATIAIPTGASTMLSGYITQAATFPGFAGILAGGSFVQLSPGGAQSGFINITGNLTAGGAATLGSVTSTGLITATSGINANGPANLNSQAVLGTLGAAGTPCVVNGVAGGGQTNPLISAFVQPGGTQVFKVDAAGNLSFCNGNAQLKLGGSTTKFIPGSSSLPFTVRNAADSASNLQVLDAGGIQVRPNGATNPTCVLPTYDYAGATTGGERKVKFKFLIVPGQSQIQVSINTWFADAQVVPLYAFACIFDDGLSTYDLNHYVKRVSYDPGTTHLTIVIDSAAVTNSTPVCGFIMT